MKDSKKIIVTGDRVRSKHSNTEADVLCVWHELAWVKLDNMSHPVTRKVEDLERVPTNEEKLHQLISECSARPASEYIAQYLDQNGVKAP